MAYAFLNEVCGFELKTHFLIAGCTGSGKSTAMHTIIDNLIRQPNNDFLMVDLKRVELSMYKSYYRLLKPVAVNEESALSVLHYAVDLMNERYEKIENGADIKNMNDVFICIDEIAELTQCLDTKKSKVLTGLLSKIARLGRAAKIHLIVATQYPTSKVLPMQLLMNIDNRLCLKTASRQGSRVVIESSDAAYIEGPGIGLLKLSTSFDLIRVNVDYHDSAYTNKLINEKNSD